jgi:hypothetical protein
MQPNSKRSVTNDQLNRLLELNSRQLIGKELQYLLDAAFEKAVATVNRAAVRTGDIATRQSAYFLT